VEEVERLRFEALVGPGVPGYLDSSFDLDNEWGESAKTSTCADGIVSATWVKRTCASILQDAHFGSGERILIL